MDFIAAEYSYKYFTNQFTLQMNTIRAEEIYSSLKAFSLNFNCKTSFIAFKRTV